jgi:hypothetical protein
MKERFERIRDYIETESYMMALMMLNETVSENGEDGERFLREARTDLELLYTCLSIVVSERAGHPDAIRQYSQAGGFYERLALLVTRKLLGDADAGREARALMFCEDAVGNLRQN